MKVTHIITGLNTGGAETMLYNLLAAMNRDEFDSSVVSLTDNGPVGTKIEALGIRVRALGMRRGIPHPALAARLSRWLRAERPDVVQTWMYHADLVGGLAARAAGRLPTCWGIHNSLLTTETNKRMTILTARACARLSRRLPAKIICCAERARQIHATMGYATDRMIVIPNGFDLGAFRPDPAARADFRAELRLAPETPLIGIAGRFDAAKDYHNFVSAAALAAHDLPNVRFVLCGDGITPENTMLQGWIDESGIGATMYLLGRRSDMPRVLAALDVAALSSVSEGLPLALGEAMACGVPCGATDAGDARELVGDTGRIAPVRNAAALAAVWRELLDLPPEARRELGQQARRRIEEHYDLRKVAARYAAVYRAVAPVR